MFIIVLFIDIKNCMLENYVKKSLKLSNLMTVPRLVLFESVAFIPFDGANIEII